MDDSDVVRLRATIRCRDNIQAGAGVTANVNLTDPGDWLFERLEVTAEVSEWFDRCGGPRENNSIHHPPEKIPFMFYNKSGSPRRLVFTAVFKRLRLN